MHLVIGGAYNGKANWVKEQYGFKDNQLITWISFYNGDFLKTNLSTYKTNYIVLQGLEKLVLYYMHHYELKDVEDCLTHLIHHTFLPFVKDGREHRLILIGTDITKGIVPVESTMRNWRDITGRFYQELVTYSNQVDLV